MTQFDIEALELSGAEKTSLREFVGSWSRHPQPVLFAGAGFSFNAKPRPDLNATSKFGSWNVLLNDIRDRLAGHDAELRSRLSNDAVRLAQIFEQHFGRPALLDVVLKHVPNDDFVPGEAHEKLRLIRWAAIVTTNYDDLIERAFHKARTVRRVISDHDLTQPRSVEDLLVLKLHGDLSARDSIVLTEEDYRRYPALRPGLSVKVRQLLAEHPLLFVGFSLTDPHFSMIDGWIRDTVHKLRLPAIAIMHTPSVPAERAMWQQRGITTVQLTKNDNLSRLFTALANEWSARVADGRALRDERATIWELQQQAGRIAAGNDADRTKQLAERLRGILANAGDEDARNPEALRAIRWFAYGWHDVLRPPFSSSSGDNSTISESELSAGDVYAELSSGEQRQLLQLALQDGIDKLRLSKSSTLDIQQELTTNVAMRLTGDEMARVHLYRARILREEGDTVAARRAIVEARRWCESDRLRINLSEEMREILFQEGDANQIAAELQHQVELDVFAMCRRGADYLLLGAVESARGWYSRALELATNGDEKYAALWGVYACRYEPHASFNNDEVRNRENWFRQELNAIPSIERKRAEATLALADEAGQALLSEDNKHTAIEKLQALLDGARQMGWPHSPMHNVTYVIETSARGAARLLMTIDRADNEDGDGAKEALPLLSRYGLAKDVHKLFTSKVCARLATDVADVEWFRRFVRQRPTLPRASDAHTAVTLRGIPLLSDPEIVDIISTVTGRAHSALENRTPDGDGLLEDWLNAIGAVEEHLPMEAARMATALLARCASNGWVMFRIRPMFDFTLWKDQGFVVPGDEQATALGSALAAAVAEAIEKRDSHWLLSLVSTIDTAAQASIFDPLTVGILLNALTAALQSRIHAVKLEAYDVAVLASAVDSLGRKGTSSVLALYASVALRLVREERRSSMFALNLYLTSRVVPQMSVRERRELLEFVSDVAESIISGMNARGLIPPATSSLGQVFVALAKALPRSRPRILDLLQRLAERDVAALPALSDVGGTSVDTYTSHLAKRALLSGESRVDVLRRLGTWFAKGYGASSPSVVELVAGLAASESQETRFRAVSAIGMYILAHSTTVEPRWFDLVASIAELDPSYVVRTKALDILRRIRTNVIQGKRCTALAVKAASSVVAIERRLAQLLAGRQRPAPRHRGAAALRRHRRR
jgi:hypothetical protein